MSLDSVTAFIDLRPASFDAGAGFWAAVTGATLSAPRGVHAEFATLLPPSGDPWLRVQRLASVEPPHVHVDLHSDEPESLRRSADGLGAVLVRDEGFASYVSPGGLPFCVVGGPGRSLPSPVPWGTHRSLVDQVCLDIPHGSWESEVDFWTRLTGLPTREAGPEFLRLDVGSRWPLRLLLQRRDDADGPTRAHLDLAADDPSAEVERVRALGASRQHGGRDWTTLVDPTGLEFCVTDRRP